MKKLILFAAILLAGISVVKAQSTGTQIESTKESVKLNVVLQPIQTLTLSSSADITLTYAEEDDYSTGVTSGVITDHVVVSSTGAFSLDVSATEFDMGTNTRGQLDLSSVKLNATKGGTYGLDATAVRSGVELSTGGKALVVSNKGGFGQKISVEYVGGTEYRDFYQEGLNNTFTTTVTYSLYAN